MVAIPFIETENGKQFFKIDKDKETAAHKIRMAEMLANLQDIPESMLSEGVQKPRPSVVDMVRKMKKFVIPPQMDFVRYYDAIEPFVMYIFSFKFTFDQQDLQDIWQGIMPDKALKHEVSTSTISHPLLANELLGQDDVKRNKLRWMIFKVKQRAQTEYKEQVFKSYGEVMSEREGGTSSLNEVPGFIKDREVSYNWPYDFFSMIELIKIDTEIKFADRDIEGKEISVVGNMQNINDIAEKIDDIF